MISTIRIVVVIIFCLLLYNTNVQGQTDFEEKYAAQISMINNYQAGGGDGFVKAGVQLKFLLNIYQKQNPYKYLPDFFSALLIRNFKGIAIHRRTSKDVSRSIKLIDEVLAFDKQILDLSAEDKLFFRKEKLGYLKRTSNIKEFSKEYLLYIENKSPQQIAKDPVFLNSIHFLMNIGYIDLFLEGVKLVLDNSEVSDSLKSEAIWLLTSWAVDEKEENVVDHNLRYNFVSGRELAVFKSDREKEIILYYLFAKLKKLNANNEAYFVYSDLMQEYYLRKAGLHEFANGLTKRNPNEIYDLDITKKDVLPFFLYAYALILRDFCTNEELSKGELAHSFTPTKRLGLLIYSGIKKYYLRDDFELNADKLMVLASFLFKESGNAAMEYKCQQNYILSGEFELYNDRTSSLDAKSDFFNPYEGLYNTSRKYSNYTQSINCAIDGGNFILNKLDSINDKLILDIAIEKSGHHFLNGITLTETLASNIADINSKNSFYRELFHKANNAYINYLLQFEDASKALEQIEAGKSRLLLDEIEGKRNTIKQTEFADLSVVKRSDSGKRGFWAITKNKKDFETNSNQYINNSLNIFKVLSSPSENDKESHMTSTMQALRNELQADELILQYYINDDGIHAFFITKEELVLSRHKISYADFSLKVVDFRAELIKKEDVSDLAKDLFQILIGKNEPLLKNKKVLIIPHNILHYLPFAALYSAKSNKYLIELSELMFAPSMTLSKHLTNSKYKKQKILVFSDPEIPGSDLPAAKEEGIYLKKLLKADLFDGAEASETRFKLLSGKYQILHLATHGVLNDAKPEYSGILFTDDGKNDGVLSVNEIGDLKLNSDLVVLSACETGLAVDPRGYSGNSYNEKLWDVPPGDDIIGLTQAFIKAGASSILSTLWQVDDEATGKMIKSFYANYAKSKYCSKSIRNAQLEMIKDQTFNHPFYWASFVYYASLRNGK
jgi:CHAT domain-containing protein